MSWLWLVGEGGKLASPLYAVERQVPREGPQVSGHGTYFLSFLPLLGYLSFPVLSFCYVLPFLFKGIYTKCAWQTFRSSSQRLLEQIAATSVTWLFVVSSILEKHITSLRRSAALLSFSVLESSQCLYFFFLSFHWSSLFLLKRQSGRKISFIVDLACAGVLHI